MSLNNNTKWIYADISDYEERNILKINKEASCANNGYNIFFKIIYVK